MSKKSKKKNMKLISAWSDDQFKVLLDLKRKLREEEKEEKDKKNKET